MADYSVGLDWIGSQQLFALLLCLFLTLIAYKLKSWPMCLVSSFGWLAVGAMIYGTTENPLLFLLIFTIAVGQSLMVYRMEDKR